MVQTTKGDQAKTRDPDFDQWYVKSPYQDFVRQEGVPLYEGSYLEDLTTLPLITHRFAVSDAADAWQLIEGKREPVLGVLLNWQDA